MKATMVVLAALMAASGVSGQATCRFGTALAVNPTRQPAPGEQPVIVPAGTVITMLQRASDGSSREVVVRCRTATPMEAWCGPSGCWIKICGNDALAFEGWSPPLRVGPEGPKGDKGDPGGSVETTKLFVGDMHCPSGGAKFVAGVDTTYACYGRDGAPGTAGRDFTPTAITITDDDRWFCARHTTGCIIGGLALAALAGWGIAELVDDDDKAATPTCRDPKATNYGGALPCTFGPGGVTGPAFSRAGLVLLRIGIGN